MSLQTEVWKESGEKRTESATKSLEATTRSLPFPVEHAGRTTSAIAHEGNAHAPKTVERIRNSLILAGRWPSDGWSRMLRNKNNNAIWPEHDFFWHASCTSTWLQCKQLFYRRATCLCRCHCLKKAQREIGFHSFPKLEKKIYWETKTKAGRNQGKIIKLPIAVNSHITGKRCLYIKGKR